MLDEVARCDEVERLVGERVQGLTVVDHVRLDERTGRILAFGVIDNLVKGAAGQGVQAFNIVHGLPETLGLEQLPLFP